MPAAGLGSCPFWKTRKQARSGRRWTGERVRIGAMVARGRAKAYTSKTTQSKVVTSTIVNVYYANANANAEAERLRGWSRRTACCELYFTVQLVNADCCGDLLVRRDHCVLAFGGLVPVEEWAALLLSFGDHPQPRTPDRPIGYWLPVPCSVPCPMHQLFAVVAFSSACPLLWIVQ